MYRAPLLDNVDRDRLINLYTTTRMTYLKTIPGVLFFMWVCIQKVGYTISIFDKRTYDTMYCFHIFFTIYELTVTWALFLSHRRGTGKGYAISSILTLFKLIIPIVIAIAGLSGRPAWMNIFFLKNIESVIDLIHTRKLLREINIDMFSTPLNTPLPRREYTPAGCGPRGYMQKITRVIKYIPIISTCYTAFRSDPKLGVTGWSLGIILILYIIADISTGRFEKFA